MKGVFTINSTTLLSLHIVLHDEVNDKSQTYSHLLAKHKKRGCPPQLFCTNAQTIKSWHDVCLLSIHRLRVLELKRGGELRGKESGQEEYLYTHGDAGTKVENLPIVYAE